MLKFSWDLDLNLKRRFSRWTPNNPLPAWGSLFFGGGGGGWAGGQLSNKTFRPDLKRKKSEDAASVLAALSTELFVPCSMSLPSLVVVPSFFSSAFNIFTRQHVV